MRRLRRRQREPQADEHQRPAGRQLAGPRPGRHDGAQRPQQHPGGRIGGQMVDLPDQHDADAEQHDTQQHHRLGEVIRFGAQGRIGSAVRAPERREQDRQFGEAPHPLPIGCQKQQSAGCHQYRPEQGQKIRQTTGSPVGRRGILEDGVHVFPLDPSLLDPSGQVAFQTTDIVLMQQGRDPIRRAGLHHNNIANPSSALFFRLPMIGPADPSPDKPARRCRAQPARPTGNALRPFRHTGLDPGMTEIESSESIAFAQERQPIRGASGHYVATPVRTPDRC